MGAESVLAGFLTLGLAATGQEPTGAIATAAPLPAPLTPASQGQVQCYVPNSATKSCQLIAAYARDAAGVIQNRATVLVSRDFPITMTTTAPVQIHEGRVCGVVRTEDFAGATFTIAGQAADMAQTADLRAHVADGMKAVISHEVCLDYVRAGETWVAKAYFDGTAHPEGDEAFIWVAADGGWRVAP
jgi:hypothetical protein